MKKIFRIALISIVAYAAFALFDATVQAESHTTASAPPSSSAVAGITFPIPELGGCASKDLCRVFCDAPGNADACIAFGRTHGLLNKNEADRGEKFAKQLKTAEGPGGCASPSACRAFCEDITHIVECSAFARSHGVGTKDIERGEKIAAYIRAGGVMPGNCTGASSCQAYCKDFAHAEECSDFAKKAGLVENQGVAGGIPPGQFQKLLELIKKGETPGGCTSQSDCKTYCTGPAHRDECIAFGDKAGLIEHERAEKLKELAGKGPGGCDSDTACRNYCNDETHHEECYAFAEKHGLLSKEEIQQTKQGFTSLREGLAQAPPEVAACVKSALGDDAISAIQSGHRTPGADITDSIRGCFQKFGHTADPRAVFRNAPSDVLACLEDKLGGDFESVQSGKTEPTPQMADAVRICFDRRTLDQTNGTDAGSKPGSPRPIKEFLKSAPPQIQECIRAKIGAGASESIEESATLDTARLRDCFTQFKPGIRDTRQGTEGNKPGQEGLTPRPFTQPQPQGDVPTVQRRPQFSPEHLACLKTRMSQLDLEKLLRGEKPEGIATSQIKDCLPGTAPAFEKDGALPNTAPKPLLPGERQFLNKNPFLHPMNPPSGDLPFDSEKENSGTESVEEPTSSNGVFAPIGFLIAPILNLFR